jgi:hypothetical protein
MSLAIWLHQLGWLMLNLIFLTFVKTRWPSSIPGQVINTVL